VKIKRIRESREFVVSCFLDYSLLIQNKSRINRISQHKLLTDSFIVGGEVVIRVAVYIRQVGPKVIRSIIHIFRIIILIIIHRTELCCENSLFLLEEYFDHRLPISRSNQSIARCSNKYKNTTNTREILFN
jgi:hypothetical protein